VERVRKSGRYTSQVMFCYVFSALYALEGQDQYLGQAVTLLAEVFSNSPG
jgi:hypothetical protein